MIDGSVGNTNWHHLDDDSSNRVLGNFVPVGSGFNTALRDAYKNSQGGEVGFLKRSELVPDRLLDQAAIWHGKWQTALAYGCARLSYYVATMYYHEPADRALVRACDACYYVRHRFNADLLVDVLSRDILPRVRGTAVSARTKGVILSQLAASCTEFGLHDHAAELFGRADLTVKSASDWTDLREAAVLRRRAMVAGTRGASSREVNAQLRESIALARSNRNAELSAMTTRAWLLQRDDRWDEIPELLEPLYRRYSPPTPGEQLVANEMTAWNLGELFYAYGAALALRDSRTSRTKVKGIMQNAEVQFALCGARPYEIVPGHHRTVLSRMASSGVYLPQLPHANVAVPQSLMTIITRIVSALSRY